MPRNNRTFHNTETSFRERQNEIFRRVADRMTTLLRQGRIPWLEGVFAEGAAVSRATGRPYSFLNQMLLGRGGEWLTFNMAAAEGGHVKRGERASTIVFWKQLRIVERDGDENAEAAGDEGDDRRQHQRVRLIPYLKEVKVFHISQIEGLEPKRVRTMDLSGGSTPDDIVSAYLERNEPLCIETAPGHRAAYNPSRDLVTMPPKGSYGDEEAYYGALFHQLAHSTGTPARCARKGDIADWFDHDEFGREELVAEMAAAMTAAHAGLNLERAIRRNADYIHGWMEAIGADSRMVVWAAGRAEKACEYILGIHGEGAAEQDAEADAA